MAIGTVRWPVDPFPGNSPWVLAYRLWQEKGGGCFAENPGLVYPAFLDGVLSREDIVKIPL